MMRALYTGSTGLKAHGQGMNVVTNNLANVNTLGFKRQMMVYEDLISQSVVAPSNLKNSMSQVGLGVRPEETRQVFTSGGFESTNLNTDLAIAGKGFFGVEKNNKTYYTRAGNFSFTADGTLVTPHKNPLLGRKFVDGTMQANTEPVNISEFDTLVPSPSSQVEILEHLGGLESKSTGAGNPVLGILQHYDGTKSPSLPSSVYSHKTPFSFYDPSGNLKQASVYYNKLGTQNGFSALEYVVSLDQASDDTSSKAGEKSAGLLLSGTLSFSSKGQLANMTAFEPPSTGEPGDLEQWTSAEARNGIPLMHISTEAGTQEITFDVGARINGSFSGGFANAAEAVADQSLFYKGNTNMQLQASSTDFLGQRPSVFTQNVDGYTSGSLRTISVNENGTLSGHYSNGQSSDLYSIALYNVTNEAGMRREGDNLFSTTVDSGEARIGIAGTDNFGKVASQKLEQSNVDFAREFTSMIITQRGFQMNSKVVTTSDQILQRALEIKR